METPATAPGNMMSMLRGRMYILFESFREDQNICYRIVETTLRKEFVPHCSLLCFGLFFAIVTSIYHSHFETLLIAKQATEEKHEVVQDDNFLQHQSNVHPARVLLSSLHSSIVCDAFKQSFSVRKKEKWKKR
jgi:hypothetical protein